MGAPQIRVSGGRRRNTGIEVRDWPHSSATWRVATVDARGRRLEVRGYHRFCEAMPVGHLDLHVDGRKPLTVRRYSLATTLISTERVEALGAMLLCAEQIAARLREDLNVGDGCLEWQLDHKQIDNVHKLFPDFSRIEKKPSGVRSGARYLRKCP